MNWLTHNQCVKSDCTVLEQANISNNQSLIINNSNAIVPNSPFSQLPINGHQSLITIVPKVQ